MSIPPLLTSDTNGVQQKVVGQAQLRKRGVRGIGVKLRKLGLLSIV
jgi:hypothetical protein